MNFLEEENVATKAQPRPKAGATLVKRNEVHTIPKEKKRKREKRKERKEKET